MRPEALLSSAMGAICSRGRYAPQFVNLLVWLPLEGEQWEIPGTMCREHCPCTRRGHVHFQALQQHISIKTSTSLQLIWILPKQLQTEFSSKYLCRRALNIILEVFSITIMLGLNIRTKELSKVNNLPSLEQNTGTTVSRTNEECME